MRGARRKGRMGVRCMVLDSDGGYENAKKCENRAGI